MVKEEEKRRRGSEQITQFGRIVGVRGFDSWASGWRRKYVEIKRIAVIENRRGGGDPKRLVRSDVDMAQLSFLFLLSLKKGEVKTSECFASFLTSFSLSQSKNLGGAPSRRRDTPPFFSSSCARVKA